MSPMFRSVSALLLAPAFAWCVSACAEENKNPASTASEQVPEESQRGTTYNKGPNKYFQGEAADGTPAEQSRAESHKAERAEKPRKEKHEKNHKHVEEASSAPARETAGCCPSGKDEKVVESKHQHPHCDKCGCDTKLNGKGECKKCGTVCAHDTGAKTVQPTEIALAEEAHRWRLEQEATRKKLESEARIRAAIRRLSTSGYREAQIELTETGRAAIPYLIDAMGGAEGASPAPAYNLGGHTKADAGRAPRQRSVAEVCAELLTDLVANHSNFKGEIPAPDQKAWQTWWVANGEGLTFGK